jgi:hypothetical protein
MQHGNLVAVGIVSVQVMAKEKELCNTATTDVHMPYLTNRVEIKKGAEATATTSSRSVQLVAPARPRPFCIQRGLACLCGRTRDAKMCLEEQGSNLCFTLACICCVTAPFCAT